VSYLRNESAKFKREVHDKNRLIVDLEMKTAETNSTLTGLEFGVGSNCEGDKEATSLGLEVNSMDRDLHMAPSDGRMRKHYSHVVAGT